MSHEFLSSINEANETSSLPISLRALQTIAEYVISPSLPAANELTSSSFFSSSLSPKFSTESLHKHISPMSEVVLSASSPQFRLICEIQHFCCNKCVLENLLMPVYNTTDLWRLYLDPVIRERSAMIFDVKRMELGQWWLLRSSSPYTAIPFPLRRLEFIKENGNDSNNTIDEMTSMTCALTANTVQRLFTNSRTNTFNRICCLSHLCGMKELRELNMKYTLVGSAAAKSVTFSGDMVGVLEQLEILTVGDYYLVRVLPIAKLTHLKIVDFSGTGVSDEIIYNLAFHATQLEELNVNGCTEVINFAPLSKLRELRILKLASTQLNDNAFGVICQNCVQLTLIDVHSCPRLRQCPHIGTLLKLRFCNLSSIHVNAKTLVEIATLPVLDTLLLQHVAEIDEASLMLAWINKLESRYKQNLQVHYRESNHEINRMYIEQPQFFSESIRTLDCTNFAMSACLFDSLFTHCKCIQHLYLSAISRSDLLNYAQLGNLKMLETLDVSGTLIGDDGIESLHECHHLTKLNVQGCQRIHNFSLIADLQGKLECLVLSDTLITEEDLASIALSHVNTLCTLHVHCCRLLRNCDTLLQLNQLKEIGVGGMTLTEDWLQTLQKLARKGVHVTTQISLLLSID